MPRPSADVASIRLLVLDVDGVLTDGALYYGPRGQVLHAFHVHDGLGIRQLARTGVHIAVISGRTARAVTMRLRELDVPHVHQGVTDKLAVFERLRHRLGISASACACVGDDLTDVAMMRAAGLAFAVADAHPSARRVAHYITSRGGGRGAVREVCDLLLAARDRRARRRR
jgi:3-deoxy-D-manno-octulosonate 8-phosphate phosphatase (KDO 8-P phosphatase)